MHRNQSVNTHQFAMVPKAEIPRSQFIRQFTHKTTFDAGLLIPVVVDEVLPGDTFNLRATFFARMATPIFPIMDNLHLDSFFFFVPNRLVWDNWQRFMGQKDNPDDSIAYSVPEVESGAGGFPVGSIFDYMGLPTAGQVDSGSKIRVNALPLRAYNLIYNEWFKDQNLIDNETVYKGDTLDTSPEVTFQLQRRGKRHDYFTSCLPWTQKGNPISISMASTAPVTGTITSPGQDLELRNAVAGAGNVRAISNLGGPGTVDAAPNVAENLYLWKPSQADTHSLVADLSTATAITINQLRQSFQIQKLLERDARGGTRYTEIVRAHFGVVSPDARLQRPEYLGGGSSPVNINPVVQNSATGIGDTPQGNLAAFATTLAHGHGFSASFTEHGYIIGLVCVRADLTYQQGLHKMWSRRTRYDFYFPAFAALGEQAVLNKEIFCDGTANDENVFGYQERWACYRYKPSQISGLFKSTTAGAIDGWHLAQKFAPCPTLTDDFIKENPPMDRVLAVGGAANGQHFIMDCFFDNKVARPMPLYSVPGMIDHF